MKKFLILLLISFLPAALFCKRMAQTADTDAGRKNITRYGSLIGLKKEFETQYIILHKYPFPGVLSRIRECHIRNYTIFLRDGMLFSHFEYLGTDFTADMALMADEVTRDWWQLTDPLQEPLADRRQGEWWASMEVLYQPDSSKISSQKTKRLAYRAEILSGRKQTFSDRLKQLDKDMTILFLNHDFQNLTVYTRDNRVYVYFEYSGSTFDLQRIRLEENLKFRDFYKDLVVCLNPLPVGDKNQYWEQMSEIFHTD